MSFFGISVLGLTRGTKGWYPGGYAHVSSPRVLGGVEDSSKDSKASWFFLMSKPLRSFKVFEAFNIVVEIGDIVAVATLILLWKHFLVSNRDNRSASLVHPTDRDLEIILN